VPCSPSLILYSLYRVLSISLVTARRRIACAMYGQSEDEVFDAAMKIQGAMKGMLFRQRMSLVDDADSVDRVAADDEGDAADVMGDSPAASSARSDHSKASSRSGRERPE